MTLNPFNWGKLWSTGVGRSDLASEYYDEILFNGATFGDLERGSGPMIMASATDLSSTGWGRSELAAQYYDEILFNGATYGDLDRGDGPFIMVSTTDISTGGRVVFNQNIFNLLCSDLNAIRLSRAASASSAVPVVLSPVTINNYGGTCNYKVPAWVELFTKSDNPPRPAARAIRELKDAAPYGDGARHPYIHLVDGGVADNLGLRAVLERVTAQGNVYETLKAGRLERTRKAVFIVVNAETEIDDRWDRSGSIPPFGAMVDSYSSIAISRYNVETIALLRESFARWTEEIRAGRCPAGQIDTAPGACGDIEFYLVEIKFDALQDPAERTYFKRLPTSFSLPADDVDKLRQAARRVLINARDFKRLTKDLER
jgi:NTE family protein